MKDKRTKKHGKENRQIQTSENIYFSVVFPDAKTAETAASDKRFVRSCAHAADFAGQEMLGGAKFLKAETAGNMVKIRMNIKKELGYTETHFQAAASVFASAYTWEKEICPVALFGTGRLLSRGIPGISFGKDTETETGKTETACGKADAPE